MRRVGFGGLILLTGILAVSCQTAQKPVTAPNETTLPDGLRVEPINDSSPDDLAQALEARLWRFRLTAPEGTKTLSCEFDLREKGRVGSSSSMSIGPSASRSYDVLVGLVPLGDTWQKAGLLKGFCLVSYTDPATKTKSKGSISFTNPNFFTGRTTTLLTGSPQLLPTHRWFLIGGSNSPHQGGTPVSPETAENAFLVRFKIAKS